jgi:hypothetical protein
VVAMKYSFFCHIYLLQDSVLLGARVNHEDGGGKFFRNIRRLSTDYMVLYPRGQNSCYKRSSPRLMLK